MTAIEKVKQELERLDCTVMTTAKIKEECCPDLFLNSIAMNAKEIKCMCAVERGQQQPGMCERCWEQEVTK